MIIVVLLLSLLLSAPWVTFQHEWCHAHVGKLLGFTNTHIYPFWHWASPSTGSWRVWRPWNLFKKPFPDARFYFARYTSTGHYPKESGHPLHIAPLYGDIIGMGVCGCLLVLSFLFFKIILYPFLVLQLCYAVDSVVWWYGYYFGGAHTDGKKYRFGITGTR